MALVAIAIIVLVWLYSKIGKGGLLAVIVLALPIIVIIALVTSFQSFNGRTLVATVRATSAQNAPHTMAIDMTSYSSDGPPLPAKSYEVGGDLWMLQCQTIELQGYLNFLGIKSGYHLQRLSGEYNGSLAGSTPVPLGNWSFFNGLENNVKLFFPVVKSAYSNAVIEPANGATYNIYADTAGDLVAEPAS